jgi:HSP20 family protein
VDGCLLNPRKNHENGVLSVMIPFIEHAKPRKIEIVSGESPAESTAVDAPACTAGRQKAVEA